ncbi:MAG: twin-arginine translocation signal domain-containing protein [Verrucomicrobiae bacterium]|nr:twin-arginine translocation signal domain-containing protein [Verrucomicrobiae bacterium]
MNDIITRRGFIKKSSHTTLAFGVGVALTTKAAASGTGQSTFAYDATKGTSSSAGGITTVKVKRTWSNGPGTGQYRIKYLKSGDTPGQPTGDTGWIDDAVTDPSGTDVEIEKTLNFCLGSITVEGRVKP